MFKVVGTKVYFWFNNEKATMDDIYEISAECVKTSLIYGSCELIYENPNNGDDNK